MSKSSGNCRIAHAVRGLKYICNVNTFDLCGRIAHAVRGLKFTNPAFPNSVVNRRIAHAVRGLK